MCVFILHIGKGFPWEENTIKLSSVSGAQESVSVLRETQLQVPITKAS